MGGRALPTVVTSCPCSALHREATGIETVKNGLFDPSSPGTNFADIQWQGRFCPEIYEDVTVEIVDVECINYTLAEIDLRFEIFVTVGHPDDCNGTYLFLANATWVNGPYIPTGVFPSHPAPNTFVKINYYITASKYVGNFVAAPIVNVTYKYY